MGPQERHARAVQSVRDYIDANYSDRITSARLARHVGLTRAELSTVFLRSVGQTVSQYLNAIRLRHALEQVLRGDKIEAVAMAVGYRSKITFYRHFQKATGFTPAAFRRACDGCDGHAPYDDGPAA
jgi:AraC-like DNA-binding protein